MKLGLVPMDTEETNKTADSTFKPKSLRNRDLLYKNRSSRKTYSLYRASHVLEDLGWVDLDLGCSTILLEK